MNGIPFSIYINYKKRNRLYIYTNKMKYLYDKGIE